MSTASPCHVVVAALQEGALARYLDFGLPSQLARGNLPALAWGERSAYKLFVRERETAALEGHPAMQRLGRLVEPTIVPLPDDRIDQGMADVVETACEGAAIPAAVEAGATLVFLTAGLILSQDALGSALQTIRSGATAVLAPRLVVSAAKAVPEFSDSVIERGGRDLVRWAWPNLHDRARAQFWQGNLIDPMPDQLFVAAGECAAVAISINPHVLAVKPERRSAALKAGSAADLVERACPDLARHHHVAGADDLALLDAWRDEDGHVAGVHRRHVHTLIPWVEHALLARSAGGLSMCRLHAGDADAEALAKAEADARALAAELARGLAVPDWHLFGFDQRRLGARLARRYGVVPPAFRARAYHPSLRGLLGPMSEFAPKFPSEMPKLERAAMDYLARAQITGAAETTAIFATEFEALWRRLHEAGR